MSMTQSIKSKLTKALNPIQLNIIDKSYKHAGHAAMKNVSSKETHFKVEIVSDQFQGKSRIAQHQMVYALLKEEFESGLHALSLLTKTKEQMDETTKNGIGNTL